MTGWVHACAGGWVGVSVGNDEWVCGWVCRSVGCCVSGWVGKWVGLWVRMGGCVGRWMDGCEGGSAAGWAAVCTCGWVRGRADGCGHWAGWVVIGMVGSMGRCDVCVGRRRGLPRDTVMVAAGAVAPASGLAVVVQIRPFLHCNASVSQFSAINLNRFEFLILRFTPRADGVSLILKRP